jgi:riboflavin kinase / FMN adenylyltransferase
MRLLLQVFRRWQDITADQAGFVVTIGNFDGVHLGHAKLIAAAVARARAIGAQVLAMTFDPHPSEYFSGKQIPRLTNDENRKRLLALQGADVLLVQKFDEQFAAMHPAEFVSMVLRGAINARYAVVGEDFRFGRDRRGTPEQLRVGGIEAEVVPPLSCPGVGVISSTAIRNFIAAGEVDTARKMLGYTYALPGLIVRGDQKGRVLGFPTANLKPDVQLIPGHGVYAGTVTLENSGASGAADDGSALPAAINVGMRPTIDGTALRVEAHALDVPIELDAWYGKRATFHFHRFLRGERKFANVQELASQISADVAATRTYFHQLQF